MGKPGRQQCVAERKASAGPPALSQENIGPLVPWGCEGERLWRVCGCRLIISTGNEAQGGDVNQIGRNPGQLTKGCPMLRKKVKRVLTALPQALPPQPRG